MGPDRLLTFTLTRAGQPDRSVTAYLSESRQGLRPADPFGTPTAPTMQALTDQDMQAGDVLTLAGGAERYRVARVQLALGGRVLAQITKEL